jgi:hypothetical protein
MATQNKRDTLNSEYTVPITIYVHPPYPHFAREYYCYYE